MRQRRLSNRLEIRRQKKEEKKTWICAFLVAIFLLCYLPYVGRLVHFTVYEISCWHDNATFTLTMWTNYIVFFKSALYPFVYYANSKTVRDTLSKMMTYERRPTGIIERQDIQQQ